MMRPRISHAESYWMRCKQMAPGYICELVVSILSNDIEAEDRITFRWIP